MSLPPGLAASRRLITIACAALGLVALLGAIAYSFQETGNNCGSGWAAATKPIPSPLLTPEEQEAIIREKRNPYEAGVAKARPIRECRSAGAKRLITAGVGGGLVLLPVGALLAYLYWPRREELTDIYLPDDDDPGEPAPAAARGSSWGDWRRSE